MELLGLVEDQANVDKWVPGPARRLSVGLPGHLGAGAGLEVGLGHLPCWWIRLGSHLHQRNISFWAQLTDVLLLDNKFDLSEISEGNGTTSVKKQCYGLNVLFI